MLKTLRLLVEKAYMFRVCIILAWLLAMLPFGIYAENAWALTTADVSVNATPAYVAISCNVSEYNFGVVAANSSTNTTTSYFGITNTSTVQTDQTIGVTTANWTGGDGWDHNDSGVNGDNATAILANKEGVWGVGDVKVKYAALEYINENSVNMTDYSFGLGLWAPITIYDGAEKTITVRVSASPG